MTMPKSDSPLPDGGYALDNNRDGADIMLGLLTEVLDPITIERLQWARLDTGDTCLELGAGQGTVASWMYATVGKQGKVTAVDVNTRHVQVPEGVRVQQCDVSDADLPEARRVHARLLLAHLPGREQVLERMVAATEKGGWVCVEEWGRDATGYVAVAPPDHPHLPQLYSSYQRALQAVLQSRGNDTSWARRVPAAMADAGLSNVDLSTRAQTWAGGSAGCMLPVAVSRQMEDDLVATGEITLDGLQEMRAGLADPAALVLANALHSTVGFKW